MRGQVLIKSAIYSLIIGYSIFTLANRVEACGPGRGGGRRLMRRKYPPLVQRQYIPNVSENTLGASGRPEGAIKRRDKRFRELVQNRNPDIEFRDDEGSSADRMMSQRLKEKLSTLAISVMNQWPNVKLRVIEGWDEDNMHSPNSLHYEGRAVDITTNDRDKSKYGMLARLAVEAGFDWVHYESRSHVHCSVKSEKADSIRNNGCFDAASLVETPNGQVQISDLQTNDLVLTMNSLTGQLQFSPFLMWLDRDDSEEELFVELTTKSDRVIRLTSSHLIYLADEPIDLTQPQLPQQQTGAAAGTELLSVVVSADGSHHGNNNHNNSGDSSSSNNNKGYVSPSYYEYALDVENTKESKNGNTESGRTNDSPVFVDSEANANELPKITSSLPRGQRRPPTIDEITYTTYARNSLVGQYLLINDQSFQQTVDQDDFNQIGANSNYKTLRGQESTRSVGRLIYPKRKFQIRQSGPTVKFDQIVSVNFVTRSGRFAPLTREGNIVVNSVVASCYAVISDHDMAHLSFAPVRWLSYLQEWLFGLGKAATRTMSRRRHDSKNSITSHGLDTQQQSHKSKYGKTIKDNFSARSDHLGAHLVNPGYRMGVHWYPQLLYRIARYILPTRFLY